jgi:hypothetical protein
VKLLFRLTSMRDWNPATIVMAIVMGLIVAWTVVNVNIRPRQPAEKGTQ